MARPLPLALSVLAALALAGCQATHSKLDEVAGVSSSPDDEAVSRDEAQEGEPAIQFGRDEPTTATRQAQKPAEQRPDLDAVADVPASEEAELAPSDVGGALSRDQLGRIPTGRSSQDASSAAVGRGGGVSSGSSGDSGSTTRRSRKLEDARTAVAAAEMKKRKDIQVIAGATDRLVAPSPDPAPVVPESNTEDYTDYGVNGFTLVERDSLSTFAVDVDTASYTITRKKLRNGYLPPAAAVRVEEFVNYFPYEYAQPDDGEPFAVDVEGAPSPYNPANHIVRVGVQGKKVAFDTRRPVNLTFLVDVSGSMQSRDKIGLLKDSLKMLTEELEDGDTVALATYAGATKVVLKPTPISQRDRILGALDGLTAGGSTAMGAGIELAYGLADQSYRPGSVNRVIVASDGDANVGITRHDQLTSYIKKYAAKGITLTTIGVGNGNYKDTMMERLANEGDGNYFYIDSLQESRRIFVDKLAGTLEVIAKDVKLQVDFNPEAVLAYRLIGYENRDVADRDFRNDKVDAGEIGAGHQVTALYEVALRDAPRGPIGTVRVRNKAPGPDSPAVERSYTMPTSALQSRFVAASAQTRLQVAAAGFAEILRGSPHMNEVTLREVAAIARDAARVEYGEDQELVQLIERAAALRGERAVSRR